MTFASRERFVPARNDNRWLTSFLYLLATIQLVWVYHSRMTPFLHLERYESGTDITPCQTRVLMMLLLRWAHHNPFLIHFAAWLSKATPIYRSHISPESFVFAITDTAGIAIAGWVATRIYEAASERQLLTAYVYPLVLAFCAVNYVLVALHPYRFYYDMPGLGFFALGLYLIYFRKNPLLFVALFLVATLNRETTLLLLLFFILSAATEGGTVDWRRIYSLRTVLVVFPLLDYWIFWHIFSNHLFAKNHFARIPARQINLVLLMWPPAWPQMLAVGCYSILPILFYRRLVADRTLRIWLWVLPAWFGIIFMYGIISEIRLYGELIPYLVCMSAIIVEESILKRLAKTRGVEIERADYSVAAD